jgi:DNA repair protein RadC
MKQHNVVGRHRPAGMKLGIAGEPKHRPSGAGECACEDCIGIHTHHNMGPELLRGAEEEADERPSRPGYYAVYPNGRIASGPYETRWEADGEARKIGGFVQFEAGEAHGVNFHDIKLGDRVTITDRFGQYRTGRAVMRGPAGWILNMGGPHGTPAVATLGNFVRASRSYASEEAYAADEDEAYADEKVSYADRKKLPNSAFALRKRRALLLTDKHGKIDAGHVKAAAARLSMMKRLGHLKPGEWQEAHARIVAAGKKVGLHVNEAREGFAVATRSSEQVKQVEAARNIILRNPKDIYEFVASSMKPMTQETFVVIPMDLYGSPLNPKPYMVAMGQRDRVQVDPGDVLRPVIEANAAAFVICHQHPSGRVRPSEADEKLTESIREAARIACPSVAFLDHCIIGANEIYSFHDKKVYKIRG